MDAGPYDNVEFPIRRPGTGTWPGPGSSSSLTTNKIQVHQATKVDKAGPKLPTVVEGTENDDQQRTMSYTGSSSGVADNVAESRQQQAGVYSQQLQQTGGSFNHSTAKAYKFRSTDQFNRRDLIPASQDLIDALYATHRKHHRLCEAVEEEGLNLKDIICETHRKAGENVSYEQLLQGMLVEGERLLLGGNWLYFTNVEFLDADGTNTTAQPLGNGRVCITSRVLLILCAEGTFNSSFSQTGKKKKYRLGVQKYDQIYYRRVPLSCIKSVELSAITGTLAETTLTERTPCCWGACSCLGIRGCTESWHASRSRTVPIARRTLTIGATLPPWGAKTTIRIHLLPEMPVTVARDLVSHLQTHAPAISTTSTL